MKKLILLSLAIAFVTGIPVSAQVTPGSVVMETIPSALSTPANGYTWLVPVLIIRYLPTADGIYLDPAKCPDFWVPGHKRLDDLLTDLRNNELRTKFSSEESTRFRGYKDLTATPSVGFSVVGIMNVYDHTPPGITGMEGTVTYYFPDYTSIFSRLDVQHYVNEHGVKEIWLWQNEFNANHPSYNPAIHMPVDYRGLQESNMSSPITGDVSNSGRYNDLPLYNHTYTVYSGNIWRAVDGTFGHIRGHQLEAMFTYVSLARDGNTKLFWQDFVGRGPNFEAPIGRAGDTHQPPNTTVDYDIGNMTLVDSDIEDWKPSGGLKKPVNADTWRNQPYNWPNGFIDPYSLTDCNWYIYWMQNMPGKNNQIPYSEIGGNMTNWWVFTGDWDYAMTNKIGLHDFDLNGIYLSKPLAAGWNWFSLNVQGPDMSVGKVLGGLNASEGDYIKNQTVSATYYNGIGWFGDLSQIDPREMYKIKLSKAGTLKFNGTAVDIGTHSITVRNGWNWIGYLEQIPRNVTDALASITPVAGDIIKNRTQSSTFNEGAGWSGEIGNLAPLDGYMLKTNHDGTLVFPGEPKSGTFTDSRDGKSYPWIRIGQQIWMAENLAWLPSVSPSSSGSNTGSFYYVYNYQGSNIDEAKANPNYNSCGVLYNWIAALTACPSGWHLPTDQEWMTLEKFLGMTPMEAANWGIRTSGSVGRQLKSTAGWNSSGNGDNSSGFTVKPGGEKNFDGYFSNFGNFGNYWSSTDYDEIGAWPRMLRHTNDGVARDGYFKSAGFSVRCIKN